MGYEKSRRDDVLGKYLGQMTNSCPDLSNPDHFIPHGLIHILEGYNERLYPVLMPAAKSC